MSEELPPYSATPQPSTPTVPTPTPAVTYNRISGNVYTTSIADAQYDYFWLKRGGNHIGNFTLSLTTAMSTPLYNIETSTNTPDASTHIQLFATSNPLPVAAARLARNPSKNDPLATTCTTAPHLTHAVWRPLLPAPRPDTYMATIPIITVPGLRASARAFGWRPTGRGFEMSWRSVTHGETGADQPVFARLSIRGTAEFPENVLEVRRGGGLEFELGVVLGAAVVLHLSNRSLR